MFKKLKFKLKNLTLKRSTALITLIATIATVYFQFIPQSQGASFTWNQTSWITQSSNNPVHVTNATGWSEYSAKDTNIAFVNGGADVQLSANSYTATDDGVFSTTGSAIGGDFDNGTNTSTQVVGTDEAASVQINTGNASTTKTSDTDFSGGTHSGTVVSGIGDGASITFPTLTASTVTHTADTDFTGSHTNTEVNGAGDAASVQLQSSQTSGTYESQTIDFGTAYASADYKNVDVSQEGGSGSVNMSWGYNNQGQLGDGTLVNKSTPIQTSILTDMVAISGGGYYSLALKSDGTAWAWGDNEYGKLGDNTTTDRTTPVQILGSGGIGYLTDIVAIAGGQAHSIALKSDGTVWTWGFNVHGQLGDGTSTTRYAPVQVKGSGGIGYLTDIVAIAVGKMNYSLALKSDGTVWAWGNNNAGNLGDGTTTNRSTPVQAKGLGGIGYLTDIVAIAAGDSHSIALKSDGTVWAWGSNWSYQLGDGTTTQRNTPVQVSGLTDAASIVAGDYHSLVLNSDGTIWAWGYNSNGQLGDNTTTSRSTPVQVKGSGGVGFLTDVSIVSSGAYHSLVLKSDGTVWAWGANNYGQLGDGTGTQRIAPVQTLGLTNVATISGAGYHSLANKGGNRFQIAGKDSDSGWQASDYKSLFRQNGSARRMMVPNSIDGKRYVRYKTMLLANDGTYTPKLNSLSINVQNAGNFTSGAIDLGGARQFTGRSFSFGATIPTEITGNRVKVQLSRDGTNWYGPNGSSLLHYDTNYCSVASGTYNCAITSSTAAILNGTSNIYYKVFISTPLISYLPAFDSIIFNYHTTDNGIFESATIDMGGGVNFSDINFDQTVGAGAVSMAWGQNNYGQLGDNTTTNRYVPVQTLSLTDVLVVSGGNSYSLALKSGGTVWSWGYNGYGQLGDNTTTNRSTPIQVLGVGGSGYLTDVVAIAAGIEHSIALKSDGTVWAWGNNQYGQLGDNTSVVKRTPVQVKGPGGVGYLTDVVAIVTRGNHSLALKADGTVWVWGANSSGQLGDNTTTSRSAPVQVKGVGGSGYLTDVRVIAGGYDHSLALKSDGTVWAWGYNGNGQLGDSTTTNRSTPVQVRGVGGSGYLTDVMLISAGNNHSFALKSDSSVWAWGYNNYGQLGDNTTTDRNTPVQVLGVGGSGYLTDVVGIVAGGNSWQSSHSLALKSDGTVWAWGYNGQGQLGDNTTTQRNTPVQVKGVGGSGYLTDVVAIMGGSNHSVAIKGGTRFEIAAKDTDVDWISEDYEPILSQSGSMERIIIPDSINSKRYIRYRANMSTNDPAYTPALNNITFNYDIYPSSQILTSSAFNTTDAADTPANIVWIESLPTGTDIKFQVRTSADGSTWSNWCGPDDGVLGSCSSATYFTDPAGTETMDDILTDQNNDQWIQYKAFLTSSGLYTPTLSDVTMTYVVNATPEVQSVSASQSTDGIVTVDYQVRDGDTDTGVTQNKVYVGLQYCTANCSMPGSETWADATTLSGDYGANVSVQEVSWSDHSLTWNSQEDYPNQVNASDFKVRIKANDSEIANNLGYGSSNTFAFDTDSPPEVQTVTASQGTDGLVDVTYEIKDPDTTNPLSATPGFVDITLQYCTANCSTPGEETWADATAVTGNAGSVATTGAFVSKALTWTPKTDYDEHFNGTDFKVRIKANDGELTNNLDYAESSTFVFDTTDPANVNISIDHTQSSNQLTLTTPTEDSSYLMLLSNLSDFAGATPEAFSSPYTWTLTDDPATVYLRIIDEFNNYTDVSATTPAKPQSFVFYDTSNSEENDYREFLAWGVVSESQVGSGFDRYEVYRSEDGENFSSIGTVTDREINYYTDDTVEAETRYYYKVVTVDTNNDISAFSTTLDDIPDGQGGTDSTPPTITDVEVTNINTTSAKVTWTTDELSDSSVGYSTDITYLPERGLASMVTSHEIILTGLTPDTTYNIRVKSHDQVGNLGQNDKDNPGSTPIPNFTFSTHPGPAISGVTVPNISNNQATITWQTTTDSSTYVVYSTAIADGALVDPDEVGTPDLVGGEAPFVHTQEITGLSENTVYYFYVKSIDASDNEAIDNNGGNFYELLTTQDEDAPIITDVDVPITDDVSAAVYWATDEPATSIVHYGETQGGPYENTAQVLTYDRSHYVILTELEAETIYYYTVTSRDINTNEATSEEYSFTTLDTQYGVGEMTEGDVLRTLPGPVISSLSVSDITGESVTVTWNTDYASSSLVKYGITEEYGSMAGDDIVNSDITKYATTHTVIINGLVPNTKYYYAAVSVDEVGNIGQSSQETFTTASPSTLSSIKVITETLKEAIISWVTSKKTSSIVEYGLTEEYGEKKEVSSVSQEHSVTLAGLESGTTYHFRVKGKDELNNLYSSGDYTFQPKSPPTISGFSIKDITERSAKVEFATNVLTDVNVTYTDLQDEKNSGSQGNPTFTSNHSLELKNLSPGREFSMKVKIRDEQGNETEEEVSNFKTIADNNPPEIEQVKTDSALTQSDKVQTIITWLTDEPSQSKLLYREGRSGEEKEMEVSPELTTKNSAVFTIFKPGTVYYFKIKSVDQAGNETVSQEYAFLTPRRQENIVQIIVGNFEEIFSWAKR